MTQFISSKPSSKGQKTSGSGRQKGAKNRPKVFEITPDDVALLDGVKFISGRQVYQFKARPTQPKTIQKARLMGI
jgi:hypothetical protein